MQSRTEARIFATHTLREMPNTKLALRYQRNDSGKDFVNGLRDIRGNQLNRPGYRLRTRRPDRRFARCSRFHAPPAISDNRGGDIVMAMRNAQFVSAKQLAVVTIDVFALRLISRASTVVLRDDGRLTSIIGMPRLLLLALLGVS